MYVLYRIILKEFLQLRRDRRMIPMLVVAPIIQIVTFGYAMNKDVTDVKLLLVDRDRTAQSRALRQRFVASRYFDLVGTEDDVGAIDPWLVTGAAHVALVIGGGYGEAVLAGRTPEVQVIADGSDSSSATVGLGYASAIIAAESARLFRDRVEGLVRRTVYATGNAAPVAAGRTEVVPRVWYNPDLLSRWFYVPAVLAMVLMVQTMILTAMGVVREKEIGTMEQLVVTPIRSWQLIVGKLTPFAVIGFVYIFLVVGIAVGWFEVPLQGSLRLLVLLTMLFLLTTLGIGLLISTMVRTQQQAMMSAVFVAMLPMIYLSGLIFPIENMPQPIQYITYAIPLRYYAVIIRGIFLKGSGLAVLWPDALALAGFGVGVLTLASLRFQKRLD